MNIDNSRKKVGAVSKQVYTTLLKGGNIDELSKFLTSSSDIANVESPRISQNLISQFDNNLENLSSDKCLYLFKLLNFLI